MLKTLRKTTWEKIEIGGIFAAEGCIDIWYKASKFRAIYLTGDHINSLNQPFDIVDMSFYNTKTNISCPIGETIDIREGFWFNKLYKLPIKVQRLWKKE